MLLLNEFQHMVLKMLRFSVLEFQSSYSALIGSSFQKVVIEDNGLALAALISILHLSVEVDHALLQHRLHLLQFLERCYKSVFDTITL